MSSLPPGQNVSVAEDDSNALITGGLFEGVFCLPCFCKIKVPNDSPARSNMRLLVIEPSVEGSRSY